MKAAVVKINIDEPCAQNWELMEKRDSERFCSSCQKCVVDFSAYSNAEIIQVLSNATQEVCGRLTRQQLDQLNYHLVLVPAQSNWMKYLGVLAIGASIFVQNASAAVAKTVPAIESHVKAKGGDPKPLQIKRIYGYVFDEDKKPLAGIKVAVIQTKYVAKTDKDGRYEIKFDHGFDVKNKRMLIGDDQIEIAQFNIDYSKEKQVEVIVTRPSFIMGKIAMPIKERKPIKVIDSIKKLKLPSLNRK
ncbi:carboxypeptidase-like regulatory domain-containing protein [Pedobacter sp. KR3-3]|uniref:Carboxypeptidase-like regulatory domain-containing protein n=1 Tax=Pedobacter albus TaxID=3113905 RepID=A0ABU7I646_9SPHI|nr:carboxypeptidase-like regulatory domain-containing protein [Pedobacter sp. KR3-3]MEE1944952.1 carboxypeptidase-like regulatory domain-containing protein [Pedobacter sp. KR3-3]